MKIICAFFLILFTFFGSAQEKVSWNVSYNEKEQQVEFRATIAEGWHLYSQFIQNDIGPVPTTFVFDETTGVKWVDVVKEPPAIHAFDENFEASLDFFKSEVLFTRSVKKGSSGLVKGYITYMVCNEIMCLPPVDVPFSISIP